MGHLDDPKRFSRLRERHLFRLLDNRLKRLERWYSYIRRNKQLGKALSVLFRALELVIVVHCFLKGYPSVP
nr:hypothetical protein [Candidatus Sigynarchaeota archaeon]